MNWYFRTVEPRYDFSWIAIHHFFSGFLIMAVGFIGIFYLWSLWVIIPILILGLWILIDDVIQHIIQRREIKGLYFKETSTSIGYIGFPTAQGYYTTVTFWHYFPYLVLDWIKRLW